MRFVNNDGYVWSCGFNIDGVLGDGNLVWNTRKITYSFYLYRTKKYGRVET